MIFGARMMHYQPTRRANLFDLSGINSNFALTSIDFLLDSNSSGLQLRAFRRADVSHNKVFTSMCADEKVLWRLPVFCIMAQVWAINELLVTTIAHE